MTILVGAKTHFSVGESIYDPEKLVKAVKKAGYSGLVVTDVNSIDAMPIMAQKADGLNIGLAVQVNVVDDLTWVAAKRNEPRKPPNPMFAPSLFVRNKDGFCDLTGLMTLSQAESHYCTKPNRPQLSLDELLEVVGRGNLSMSLGSAYSVLSHKDRRDKLEKIASALARTQTLAELVPVTSAYFDQHNAESIKAIEEYGFTPIITRPVLNQEGEVRLRNAMNCILDHQRVDAMFRREPVENLHVLSEPDLEHEFLGAVERVGRLTGNPRLVSDIFDQALRNTNRYFIEHTYKWSKLPASLPAMSEKPFMDLVQLCKQGWKDRLGREVFGYKPTAADLPQYRERLKYELEVLRKMGFESYFMLVHYLVNWSRTNGILTGPGRGSVGGSLVAYLMGITDVDPIRFGLIFERFINPDRIDLPDIDLDFMSSRRQEIVEHLVDHFGSDRVACIANYSTIAGAGAIRDAGKAYGLYENQYDCSKLVPKEAGVPVALEVAVAQVPELEKFALAHPQVWKTAVGLQGCFKHFAQHAAGVIVAGEPVVNRAVVNARSGMAIVNWDKRVVEDFGLIKLDVLGLANLDVLRLAKDYIRRSHKLDVDLTTLPLDDAKVLEAFAAGKTCGVFQFESGGMRRLLKDLGADGGLTFDDLVAATALFRPGPIQSGMMERYVSIKRGYQSPEYPHPATEEALKETYSVICYQEQVMKVARDLAGYSMAEADHLRKIMGKKDPVKMAEQREKFVDGCVSTSGMAKESAESLFDGVEKFAGYGFNKSHAAAYTLISYTTMWLKVYYPEAFYAACLSVFDESRLMSLTRDAETLDIHVVPPDINKSTARYEPGFDSRRGQKVLYAPFQAIKGIAEGGAQAIIEARTAAGGGFKSKADFIACVNRRKINVRHQDSLDRVGAFALVEPGQLDPRHPDRVRDQKELLPGIVTCNVKADRGIIIDAHVQAELENITLECQSCTRCPLGGTNHPLPFMPRKPKVMVVMDMPSWKEEEKGQMGVGDTGGFIKEALKACGMKPGDIYITSLIKARKPKEMDFENSMVNECSGYLDREVQLLKPPVIVALGGKAIRHFVPDVKGGWEELCGKSHYDIKLDCTVVFGLNPAQICFDETKQAALDEVFKQVAEIFA